MKTDDLWTLAFSGAVAAGGGRRLRPHRTQIFTLKENRR